MNHSSHHCGHYAILMPLRRSRDTAEILEITGQGREERRLRVREVYGIREDKLVIHIFINWIDNVFLCVQVEQ